tara:strand:- start:1087 stop:1239 length:153 start_codon:yes stop_codon:yes gene_type:complete
MEIISELIFMDGKGAYVWSVLIIFFVILFINIHLPRKELRKLKYLKSKDT